MLRRFARLFSKQRQDLDRWKNLKASASGMLSPAVYRELYRTALNAPDLDIVEIGGAAGAGSIALALGMKESGKRSHLIVAEKLEGGSRSDIGGRSANLEIIEDNFRKFDVREYVKLFTREVTWESGAEIVSMVDTGEIGALVLDADGRIDRDFSLFWPMLVPGAAIVIDDYREDRSKFRPISERHPTGGAKLMITFRLTNYLVERGLFRIDNQIGSTLFGRKPETGSITALDRTECERIIADVLRERDEELARRGLLPN